MEYGVGIDWLIIIATFAITLGSQWYIKRCYKKTIEMECKKEISGKEVARKILDSNDLQKVTINEVVEELSDHYDPRNKSVSLSTDIYRKTTIASISVAAHECGHAIQDKTGYAFLRIRQKLVPTINFISSIGYVVLMIGLLSGIASLFWLGILLECCILFFQLITLPVEFDASRRGLEELKKLNIIENSESKYVKKMLRAAALTYVASVASSILQILRLLLLSRRND